MNTNTSSKSPTYRKVEEVKEGIACFEKIGELLGKESYFYLGAVEGCDRKMNIDLENYLSKPFTREAMIAEAMIQLMMHGVSFDREDIRESFANEHWVRNVLEMGERYQAL